MFRICLAVAIYAFAIGIGCDLRFRYPNREDMHYVLFRDLVPLLVAIPAAWLAYCFQRRASYLQQLRAVWVDVSSAAQGAIRYTHASRPTLEAQRAILESLGGAIEAVRGLFRPGRASPASSLATIRDEIEALGSCESVTALKSEAARSAILAHWYAASTRLLHEFDRIPASSTRPLTLPPVGSPGLVWSRLTARLTGR
jgi:hypothetical protein